jgi:structural toxin protein (hemagglutinin/hemolysin) RtxA
MYKICFYVPESHLEQVKNAMFAQGAGNVANYSHCAWQVLGQGQFKPLSGSHAYIGETNQLEVIAEYKVEVVCVDDLIKPIIAAMKKAHPYEIVAYQVFKLENF